MTDLEPLIAKAQWWSGWCLDHAEVPSELAWVLDELWAALKGVRDESQEV